MQSPLDASPSTRAPWRPPCSPRAPWGPSCPHRTLGAFPSTQSPLGATHPRGALGPGRVSPLACISIQVWEPELEEFVPIFDALLTEVSPPAFRQGCGPQIPVTAPPPDLPSMLPTGSPEVFGEGEACHPPWNPQRVLGCLTVGSAAVPTAWPGWWGWGFCLGASPSAFSPGHLGVRVSRDRSLAFGIRPQTPCPGSWPRPALRAPGFLQPGPQHGSQLGRAHPSVPPGRCPRGQRPPGPGHQGRVGADPAERGGHSAAAQALRGLFQQRGPEPAEDLPAALRHRHLQPEYGCGQRGAVGAAGAVAPRARLGRSPYPAVSREGVSTAPSP